ncbi:MAG TPA: hypothetical protein VHQ97_06600 [Solirubrobacterales bacterium]|jgi:hypothetical protein|nr:hypothetical protein [Solirubrobacterales bacterium]
MKQQSWRPSPAMLISLLALLLALGGTVYAANRINGRTIRARSIPGNRLRLRSVPANRLRPGVLGRQITGPLTGADIDEGSLGTVPSAVHAQSADTARSAIDAETALNAVNAVNAQTVNGFGAGCASGSRLFAGACWDASPSTAATAPAAAIDCAARGGALPEALQLAAFAGQEGVSLDEGGEWSSDIAIFSGPDTYGVATVSTDGKVDSVLSTNTRKYRCVIPLVS